MCGVTCFLLLGDGCCSSYNLCFCYLFPTPSVAVQLFFWFLSFFISGYQRKTYCILGRKFYCICFKRKAFCFFPSLRSQQRVRRRDGLFRVDGYYLGLVWSVGRSVGRFCFESHGWMDFIEMGYLSLVKNWGWMASAFLLFS